MSIDWNKLSQAAQSVIKVAAPTVGLAFGGPLGGLAGNMLAQTLGCLTPSGQADTKQVEALLTDGSPDTFLKLKQAEDDFTTKMEQLGIQREQLAVQDRANARDLASKDFWTPRLLAGLIYASFVASAWFVMTRSSEFPPNIALLVGNITGAVGALSIQVANFYFGTSSSSESKTAMLFNSTPIKS